MIEKLYNSVKDSSIIKKLEKYPFFKNLGTSIKESILIFSVKKFTNPNFFYNLSNNQEKCCIILAGYKEFLWDVVFSRIKMFIPDDIDVCVVSSGLFSEKLHEICKKNNWSYMTTKRNSIPLALNTAIKYFPNANKIYKIDEDMFITKNFFSKTYECYNNAKNSDFFPGFVGPIIPINGYGHLKVLKEYSLEEEYEKRFEKPKYAAGPNRLIEKDPQVAKFFWGDTDHIPSIDEMDDKFSKNEISFSPCPIRFSIGAILFERSTWENMGYFTVDLFSSGLGRDELQICSLPVNKSQAIIVCENTLVGHLSFRLQNDAMKEYFLNHPEKFTFDDKHIP